MTCALPLTRNVISRSSSNLTLEMYLPVCPAAQISAHFAEIYGASVSKETISQITDKALEKMTDWCSRPLDGVYAAILVDAVMVKVRDGQVANRPIDAAIGVTLAGSGTSWGAGVGRIQVIRP
jgi:putative transposase